MSFYRGNITRVLTKPVSMTILYTRTFLHGGIVCCGNDEGRELITKFHPTGETRSGAVTKFHPKGEIGSGTVIKPHPTGETRNGAITKFHPTGGEIGSGTVIKPHPAGETGSGAVTGFHPVGEPGSGRRIAYLHRKPLCSDLPTVVYASGMHSVKEGRRGAALDRFSAARGYGCVRFELEGLGESVCEGFSLRDVVFDDWVNDIRMLLEEVTPSPAKLVLVGFSLGTWLTFRALTEKVIRRTLGIVFIAFACNCIMPCLELSYKRAPEDVRRSYDAGQLTEFNDPVFGQLWIRRSLVESSLKFHIQEDDILPVTCPVRFLHGMKDHMAPCEWPVKYSKNFASENIEILIQKGAGHKFDRSQDYQLMFKAIDDIVVETSVNSPYENAD